MKSPDESGRGVITAGTTIVPFPANEKQRRRTWLRTLAAWRSHEDRLLLAIHRAHWAAYLAKAAA